MRYGQYAVAAAGETQFGATSRRLMASGALVCWVAMVPVAHAQQFFASIGSFQSADNARELSESVGSRFGTAFHVYPRKTAQGTFYRVLAGPYAERGGAEHTLAAVTRAGLPAQLLIEAELSPLPEPAAPTAAAEPARQAPGPEHEVDLFFASIGSFSELNRARDLLAATGDRLGARFAVHPHQIDGRTAYRVLAGPYLDRSAAERTLANAAAAGLPTQIVIEPGMIQPLTAAGRPVADTAAVAAASAPVAAPAPASVPASASVPAPASIPAPDLARDAPAAAAIAAAALAPAERFYASVGSFQSIENARQLSADVSDRLGTRFAVHPSASAGGTFYRVAAGPFLERSTAEATLVRAASAGLPTQVVVEADTALPGRLPIAAASTPQRPFATTAPVAAAAVVTTPAATFGLHRLRRTAGGGAGRTAARDEARFDFKSRFDVGFQQFSNPGQMPEQRDAYYSVALEPELVWSSASGADTLSAVPFVRTDVFSGGSDTFVDVRELLWTHVGNHFESRVGVNKVFWGVTESQHLVDIINSIDLVSTVDGETKLGQPMVNVAFARNWGNLDLFVLPYFREQRSASTRRRFHFGALFPPALSFERDDPVFVSDREEQHIDFAARWAHSFGHSDIALSYFDGTARQPGLEVRPETGTVHPLYDQISRVGLEYQLTIGSWLWKLEAINQWQRQDEDFSAFVAGFEYTLYSLFGTSADLGLLLEHNYDSRGFDELAVLNPAVFQNDSFVGTRFALNNISSTSLLIGLIYDHDNTAKSWLVEGSTRIGSRLRITLEARMFSDVPTNDLLHAFAEDDFARLEVSWFL